MEVVVTSDLPVVYELRRLVLRQGELSRFGVASDADRHPGAVHVVAYRGDEAIGTMSLIPEPCPGYEERAFELVGMAVLDTHQKRGVGAALFERGLTEVEDSCDIIWAKARCTSIGFYARQGFQTISEVYDILPGVPHRTMVRAVTQGCPMTPPAQMTSDKDG